MLHIVRVGLLFSLNDCLDFISHFFPILGNLLVVRFCFSFVNSCSRIYIQTPDLDVDLEGLFFGEFLIQQSLDEFLLRDRQNVYASFPGTELLGINSVFRELVQKFDEHLVVPGGRILLVWQRILVLHFFFGTNLDWSDISQSVFSLNVVDHSRRNVRKYDSFAMDSGAQLKRILQNQGQLAGSIGNVILLARVHGLKSAVPNAFFQIHERLVDFLTLLLHLFVVKLGIGSVFRTSQVEEHELSDFDHF